MPPLTPSPFQPPSRALLPDLFWSASRVIRPLLGPPGACRYTITCTRYAAYVLRTLPLHQAFWQIFCRILSCW